MSANPRTYPEHPLGAGNRIRSIQCEAIHEHTLSRLGWRVLKAVNERMRIWRGVVKWAWAYVSALKNPVAFSVLVDLEPSQQRGWGPWLINTYLIPESKSN